jgi:hypothetical protein
MVTDQPYGIELDSECSDRAGLNGCGPAEASYMKHRTEGHTETTMSSDTRADWSELAILDYASSARAPSCRVGNGSGKKNALTGPKDALWLILNETGRSKMEIPAE